MVPCSCRIDRTQTSGPSDSTSPEVRKGKLNMPESTECLIPNPSSWVPNTRFGSSSPTSRSMVRPDICICGLTLHTSSKDNTVGTHRPQTILRGLGSSDKVPVTKSR